MNDQQKYIELLESFAISFGIMEINGFILIGILDEDGYMSGETSFVFDRNGKFVKIGE